MEIKIRLCILIKLLCLTLAKRPFWNIGHMVNSAIQVNDFLGLGSNAIESDVSFHPDGTPLRTYHGVPCDCGRSCNYEEDIDSYIEHIEVLTNPKNSQYRSDFILQMFDLKLSSLTYPAKEYAIQQLITKIVKVFGKSGIFKSDLQFLFSIPTSGDIKLISVAHETLKILGAHNFVDRIGWDVYSYEEIADIGATYRVTNLTSHVWQGDGITNCLPRRTKRLQEAIEMRDSKDPKLAYNSKVYFWTIDLKISMRKALRHGVDAIITNYPTTLNEVLEEEEFSKYFRLATAKDNFWTRYVPPPGSKKLIASVENIDGYDPEAEYF